METVFIARTFIARQMRQIAEEGVSALLRKIRVAVPLLLAVPVVLLARLLRPLIVLRFEQLGSDRIGHFAASIDLYLREREAGMHPRRAVDIFYHTPVISNRHLKAMWERSLPVASWAGPVDVMNRRLPGAWQPHTLEPTDQDRHGLRARTTAVHLRFRPEELERGYAALRELGIPDGVPWVCFHARDAAYLDAMHPESNWRYHDYRDSQIRNYLPAAEAMTHRGYLAVRMGAIVQEVLHSDNPRIIDYATKGRTDFLDVFLGAHCRFFICSGTGIAAIPTIYRRPIAHVNIVQLLQTPIMFAPETDLIITKKLWLRSERRFLTFREGFAAGTWQPASKEQFDALGLECLENTPEEIAAVAIEMDERLRGTWRTAPGDDARQARFRELWSAHGGGGFQGRIGAEFLRQYEALLN